jgi:DNA-binding response OmpR family regulator
VIYVGKEKILVVEDNVALASGLKFAFTREGWEVSIANNLSEAKKTFKDEMIDLILLDVMLPDGSGLDFCREVRSVSSVPIIFLTAKDEELDIIQGLEIGGDDYITKPFRVGELTTRIKVALRRINKNQTQIDNTKSVLKTGNLTIDILDGKIKNGETDILVTPIEFKLIKMFVQNPLQILTRNQILEKLWDIDGDYVDEKTLTVHIRRLREKIEEEPSNPKYIVTIRGVGYKWNMQLL